MKEGKNAWGSEIKKTLTKAVSFVKTHRIEVGVGLVLAVSAIAPIILYHCDRVNIYNVMVSDAVAAYTTAIYVSVMLAFKLVNDVRRDKLHYDMIVYRDNRMGINASADEFAGQLLRQTALDLLAAKKYDSRTRMVRYLAVWVSYMFVSFSYAYVRNAVGG